MANLIAFHHRSGLLPKLTMTLSAVFLWAFLSVTSRIVLLKYDLDAWAFSFLQLVAGGLLLLLIGAKQGGAVHSFTRVSTWVLGALRVVSAALYTAVLAWISVLEAGIIGAMNLPIIAAIVWVLSKQRPPRQAWLGHGVLLLAVVVMSCRVESDLRGPVLLLMVLNAFCLAAMNLIAEKHPENRAGSLAARAWFTGVVLVVTAGLFAAARLMQGEGFSGLLDPKLLWASLAVGVLLRAPSMFLTFSAIRMAGAQGYTAAIAFLPLFGMVLEQASFKLGLLGVSRFQVANVYIALVALAGTLIVWSAKRPLAQSD